MLRADHALFGHLTDAGGVAAEQRLRVKPQAGEDLAAVDAVRPRFEALAFLAAQDEPVEGGVFVDLAWASSRGLRLQAERNTPS